MASNLSQFSTIPISRLRVGVILRAPIYDEASPVLLINSGQQLTPDLLERLKERGIKNVRVDKQDFERVTGGGAGAPLPRLNLSRMIPDLQEGSDQSDNQAERPKNPFSRKLRKSATAVPRAESAAAFSDKFQRSIVDLSAVYKELEAGEQVNQKAVLDNVSATLQQMVADFDLFSLLAMEAQPAQYPFSHSLQVANLSMAVGVVLEMDEVSLVELGVGCMLHDLGMLKLAPQLLNCERPLDLIEKLDITKHPAMTFDMIQNICGIPVGSRLVAYQMHERLDGTGYPRRRVASQIHPFSKVAMVADSFIAMTSPRPHRAAVPPYCAMMELLEAAQLGKYDHDAVRGLLHTVSLFPLGSFVELSDRRVGKVVRSNREFFTRPAVEAWNRRTPQDVETVDLLERDNLQILQALLPAQLSRSAP